MQYALLRANEWQQLALGIEGDAVPPLIEACHGLAQLGRALCGLITVSRGVVGHLAQLVNGLLRRWHVGAAYGQADNVLALGIEPGHLLQLPTKVVFTH